MPDTRDQNALDDFFSVRKETNENTLEQIPPPSLSNVDIVYYDHVHMPYPRLIGDTGVIGLGAYRNNHALTTDCVPDTSIHLSSFGESIVHEMHFDAELDAIFEHVAFDSDDDYAMYQVPVPYGDGNFSSAFKPVQSRFHNDQYNREADESVEDQPKVRELDEFVA